MLLKLTSLEREINWHSIEEKIMTLAAQGVELRAKQARTRSVLSAALSVKYAWGESSLKP